MEQSNAACVRNVWSLSLEPLWGQCCLTSISSHTKEARLGAPELLSRQRLSQRLSNILIQGARLGWGLSSAVSSEASVQASISRHPSPPCRVHHSTLLLTRAGRNVVVPWSSHLLLQAAPALTPVVVGFTSADLQFVASQIWSSVKHSSHNNLLIQPCHTFFFPGHF